MKTDNNGAQRPVVHPDMNPRFVLDHDEITEDKAPSYLLHYFLYDAFTMNSAMDAYSANAKPASLQSQCLVHLRFVNEHMLNHQEDNPSDFHPKDYEDLTRFLTGIGTAIGEVMQALRLTDELEVCGKTIRAAEKDAKQ